jgi:hypothetical protein
MITFSLAGFPKILVPRLLLVVTGLVLAWLVSNTFSSSFRFQITFAMPLNALAGIHRSLIYNTMHNKTLLMTTRFLG